MDVKAMSTIRVEADRIVDARPRDVYAFLADYTDKRPTILPPAYEGYTVEKGGRGAGTVVRYVLNAGRRRRPYRLEVGEPSKRSVLTEKDTGSSLVTTWTVDAVQGSADRSRVTLTTQWEGSGGVGGFFERTFAPRVLQRLYADMLSSLATAVA
jgi:hypothetical protein